MFHTKLQWEKAASIGLAAAVMHAFIGVAQAVSEVPKEWNVTPATGGAYIENFETVPTWATAGGTAAAATTAISGQSRGNSWSGSHANVLELNADPAISSAVTYPDASAVSFATQAVYVDMRVAFTKSSSAPESTLWDGAKLALYLNDAGNLVVQRSEGAANSTETYTEGTWYQLTVKLLNGQCDVLVNDTAVSALTGLTLMAGGTANQLASVDFYGSGKIDDLYVGHGNPARAANPPAFPATQGSGGAPTEVQKNQISEWLIGKTLSGDPTQTDLGKAYLVNKVNAGVVAPVSALAFGVADIEVLSTTSLKVTLKLDVDSEGKDGTINGKVQMQGRATQAAGWTDIGSLITPTFTDGLSEVHTVTFTEGPKFFRATIVP